MPTTTQIEYVLAVAQHRHFGRAAEHCHVSQPSLSMQIQKLEDELGIVVFDRNKKPIAITPQGEALVIQAQKMMAEYYRLIEISRNETGSLKGTLRLGVIPTLSSSMIPLFVKKFADKLPEIDLTVSELTTENLLEKIKFDEIDIGLLVTPVNQPSLTQDTLFYEGFSVYCSPKHPLLNKDALKLADLNQHKDQWILSDGHCFKNQVLNFCGLDQNLRVFNNVHFQSGSLETLMEMVRRGQGYTFLPELHVRHIPTHEKKYVRPFLAPVPSREVSLVYTKNHWKTNLFEALSDVLQSSIPTDLERKAKRGLKILDISS